MESRLLLLPRHLSLSAAWASADAVAGEICALLANRNFRASVTRAVQFIRSEVVTASGVAELYRAVAAAAPRGQPRHLGAAASALVEASTCASLPDGALRLLEQLVDTPAAPQPSGSSCGHLMVKLLSLGRHADARRVLETLTDLGERQRNKAISELWRAGRGADAVKVFGEMAYMAVVPNRFRYVDMMDGFLKKGDLEAASKLRTQMKKAAMKLSKQQRNMLRMLVGAPACPGDVLRNEVEFCIMTQDIDEAIRRLRHRSHDGTARSKAYLYNLVIARLWKVGRGDDAVKMFGEMADMVLALNAFSYDVMINGHLKRLRLSDGLTLEKNKNGDLEAAFELRAHMVQEGFRPDEVIYRLLMAELCSAERLADVASLFHEMMIQGTTLYKIVHGSLLKFLIRINEDQLLGIVEESAKNGIAAKDNCCITLLKELCRIQKVSRAEKVLQTFAKSGLVPTREMYNILIGGYCRMGQLQGAFLLCRQMESHDQLVPNEATYKALLLAVRNSTSIIYWEDVVELFEKNGVSTDALDSVSCAIYGFKHKDALRMLKDVAIQLMSK